ncbi:conserved hypothetical protein [Candidatus Magnetomoraceae bacterium gMMP-15]
MIQKRSTGIIIVLIIGFLTQVGFAKWADIETPQQTLIKFCEACFQLDEAVMDELVTEEGRIEDDVDLVAQYLINQEKMAHERGYRRSYAKSCLRNVITQTICQTEDEAEIRIMGTKIVIVDLLMRYKTYEFDHTFKLVKEDGHWKINGGLASLN